MQNQALHDLLRRWLRGETRGSEESRLERATQDDPFLADAWEGFSQNPKKDHLSDVDAIQARIASRTKVVEQRKSGTVIWWPRLAAAAAVLLLLTFSWKWWFAPDQPEELAIEVPDQVTATHPSGDTTPPEVADLQLDKMPKNEPNVAVREPAAPKLQPPIAAEKESANQGEVAVADDLVSAERAATRSKSDSTPDIDGPANVTTGNTEAKDLAKVSPAPSALREISTLQSKPTVGGIVLDDKGQRALGIPVQRDANTFAITNRDGSFELPSAAPTEVQVVAADFEKQSLRLDDNEEKVVLQRKTKAQKKSFDASDRREGIGYPSPVGGFEAFEQYIKNNLEIPSEAKLHFINGTVTLEFTFEKDGTPTRFNVLRGLGFGCDQVAQHLIENGPKWKNVKPGTWVIYKVVFR